MARNSHSIVLIFAPVHSPQTPSHSQTDTVRQTAPPPGPAHDATQSPETGGNRRKRGIDARALQPPTPRHLQAPARLPLPVSSVLAQLYTEPSTLAVLGPRTSGVGTRHATLTTH